MKSDLLNDPYAVDSTTKVSVVIDGDEQNAIETYEYNSDVLSLGDPAAVVLPNPKQVHSRGFRLGSTFDMFMADPNVSGGQKVPKLKGRVISRQSSVSKSKGSIIALGGADLGWHLQATCGNYKYATRGKAWSQIIQDLIDPGWGIKPEIRSDNEYNRKIKLGRALVEAMISPRYKAIPPRFQIEPGEDIASKLITFAMYEQRFISISHDGYFQIWTPNYNQEISYKFYNYADDDSRRTSNNCESAVLNETIDGVYSKVACIGSIINVAKSTLDSNDPNAGRTYGEYVPSPNPLPFNRFLSFGDGEQTNNEKARIRARWKYNRGIFDSWTYQIEVKGHVQNGAFYEADTMCYVDDPCNGIRGNYWVSAVKYMRSKDRGTRTALVIKKPNLLSA